MGILNEGICDRCSRKISEEKFLCQRCEERDVCEGHMSVMEIQNDREEPKGKIVKLIGQW